MIREENSFPLLTQNFEIQPTLQVNDPYIINKRYTDNIDLEFAQYSTARDLVNFVFNSKEAARNIHQERRKADNLANIADHLKFQSENLEEQYRGKQVESTYLASENQGLMMKVQHLENENALLRRSLEQMEDEVKQLRLREDDFGHYDKQVRTQFDVIKKNIN